jgi:hypothetical protein
MDDGRDSAGVRRHALTRTASKDRCRARAARFKHEACGAFSIKRQALQRQRTDTARQREAISKARATVVA